MELIYNCFLLLCSLVFFYLFFSDTIKEKEDNLLRKAIIKLPDSVKEIGGDLQESIVELSNSIEETGDNLRESVVELSNSLKDTKQSLQEYSMKRNSDYTKKHKKDPKAA